MQLPPLEVQTPQTGKTAPEEKQDPGAGFSDVLALALGAGLSLFGPEGQGGAEARESLMEALDEGDEPAAETGSGEESEAVEESEETRPRDADSPRDESPGDSAEAPEERAPSAAAPAGGERGATPLAAGAVLPGAPAPAAQPLESLAATLKTEGAASAATRTRPAARGDLAGRVTRILQVMKQDGETLFRGTLRLAQGELGRLRVDLEMKDDSLSVRFLVDGEEARQALEAQMEKLRESLRDQGFANLEITVELGESSGEEARGSESPEPEPGEEAGDERVPPRAESRWDGLLDLLA